MNRELYLMAIAGGIILGITGYLLGMQNGQYASQWLLQSGLLWCLVWQQTWQRRERNRAGPDMPLYADLGWANRITLLRGGLIALTGGFLFQAQGSGWLAWVPGLLYSAAAILDRVDGFIARRTRQTSVLGNQLDTIFDALGLVVAPLLAVGYGKVHWTYLLVSVAYYLFQWGVYWRHAHGLPVYPLLPNTLRRSLAGFQMGFIAVVLLPPFQAPLTLLIGAGFMVPVLVGFVVDWLVVSGRIPSNTPAATQFFNRLAHFSNTVFQPVLRILLVIAVFFASRDFGLSLLPKPETALLDMLLAYALLLCAMLVLLGVAGRSGALALILLLAGHYSLDTFDALAWVLVFSAVWVLLLGSGRFSLWQQDEAWINRHDGA